MANLIGGSTVGGKEILSVDAMNQLVHEIKNDISGTSMEKYEEQQIVDASTLAQHINNPKMNGVWQFSAEAPLGLNGLGIVTNLSNSLSGFQMYATLETDDDYERVPTLAFRTKLDSKTGDWKKIITDYDLDRAMDKKLDKSGGTITGSLFVEDGTYLKGGVTAARYLNLVDNYNNMNVNVFIEPTANGDVEFYSQDRCAEYKFDNKVKVLHNDAKYEEVWHTGTLSKSEFMKSNATTGSSGTTLSDITETGHYIFYDPTDCPSAITGKVCLEVFNYDGSTIKQTVSNASGEAFYKRYIDDGAIGRWTLVSGSTTLNRVAVGDSIILDSETGLYYFDWTHNQDSTWIASVSVVDMTSNESVISSFMVLNKNTVRVYVSESAMYACTLVVAQG